MEESAKESTPMTKAQLRRAECNKSHGLQEPASPQSASTQPVMAELSILQNPEVAARTSSATRRVLEERAEPAPYAPFLSAEHMGMLRSLVDAILPQTAVGTHVDIAEAIDRRLAAGENAGFRYVVLPPDGEAYRQGLTIFFRMLEQTPMKTFERMPPPAREGYIRCVCNGDVDGPAQFPLSTFVRMLRTDVVRFWIAHPDAMRAIGYFGFADGATGNEGWRSIGPNSAAPFEYEGIREAGVSTQNSQQVGAQ
ncbi:MAG: gluconate 2-dehydrogenase subunit 3 family protein [Terriglobus roseus]|nr:gluconate 2-dehydrogenase subunit 3 family protein [Terriglobus roseus]